MRVQRAGVDALLTSLGRDRFALEFAKGGERLLAVRVFNAQGAELEVVQPSFEVDGRVRTAEIQTHGIPARIELIVATEMEQLDFDFSLELEDAA